MFEFGKCYDGAAVAINLDLVIELRMTLVDIGHTWQHHEKCPRGIIFKSSRLPGLPSLGVVLAFIRSRPHGRIGPLNARHARQHSQSEAKALNGHSGMRNDDDNTNKNDDNVGKPEKLFQRRYPPPASQASASPCPASASSAPDPAHTAESTTAHAVAAGKNSQRSGTRENKRSSRLTPPRADSSGGPPAPRLPHDGAASGTSDTGTRGRPEMRAVGTVSAAAAAVERPPRAESSPSPPPTAPAGRLADRIRTLRERCSLGLGADAFERAYGYLKVRRERCGDRSIPVLLSFLCPSCLFTSSGRLGCFQAHPGRTSRKPSSHKVYFTHGVELGVAHQRLISE